jgi:hypothetical protein
MAGDGATLKADAEVREPIGMTLGDLVAVVAGVAIVLTIPWKFFPHPTDFFGPWPRWLPRLWLIQQVLEIAGLAMLPVVLARRARLGGLARPAEILLVCCGLPALVWGIETTMLRSWVRVRTGLTVPGPGMSGMPVALYSQWSEGPHWTWEWGLLLTAAAASAALLAGRRRIPGWVGAALLFLAWAGLYEAGPVLLERSLVRLIVWVTSRPVGELAGTLLSSLTLRLPRFLLYALPALAALREVRQDGLSRQTWLCRTGLVLPVLLFLVAETAVHARDYYYAYSPGDPWLRDLALRGLTMAAAAALALLILGRPRVAQGPTAGESPGLLGRPA